MKDLRSIIASILAVALAFPIPVWADGDDKDNNGEDHRGAIKTASLWSFIRAHVSVIRTGPLKAALRVPITKSSEISEVRAR